MDKLIIFTLDGCSHCLSLKKRLTELNLTYKEVEVSQNKEVWDSIVKEIKHEFVPTILISPDNSENGVIFVPSINYQTEDEIVNIIKSYF
jgi:glutaredoxin